MATPVSVTAHQTGESPGAPRIAVVDDDPMVSDVVYRYLTRAGCRVTVFDDGISALQALTDSPPDLIVLDLMLPGLGGLELFRRLRRVTDVPVIMLTALSEESDRLVGLALGADDYVTKPFSPRELVLRVQAVLRRGSHSERMRAGAAVPVDGGLYVDTRSREARLDGRPLPLTSREFDLMTFLLQHPGQVFNRQQLLKEVWGWDFADHSTVTVHIRRLREKVEADPRTPRRVITVFGVGYRYDNEPGSVRDSTEE